MKEAAFLFATNPQTVLSSLDEYATLFAGLPDSPSGTRWNLELLANTSLRNS